MTPCHALLGRLMPVRVSRLDENYEQVSGDRPMKELPPHHAFHGTQDLRAQVVVHLHWPYSVARFTIDGLVGEGALLLDHAPGDAFSFCLPSTPDIPEIGRAMERLGGRTKAVLVANHGPVVADVSLEAAVEAIEELEDAARLAFYLGSQEARCLGADQIALEATFPLTEC